MSKYKRNDLKASIVFFGDSITAGSKTIESPLGNGFVSMLAAQLNSVSASDPISVVNSGINGNTVQNLLQRYRSDVIIHNPDTIVIKIGINDAYNDFFSDTSDSSIQHYETDYRRLIQSLRSELPECRILLLTPYYISDSKADLFYKRMAEYIGIVNHLGAEFKLSVFNVQEVFNAAILDKPARAWAADQIHPVSEGHQLMAQHIYDFLLKELVLN